MSNGRHNDAWGSYLYYYLYGKTANNSNKTKTKEECEMNNGYSMMDAFYTNMGYLIGKRTKEVEITWQDAIKRMIDGHMVKLIHYNGTVREYVYYMKKDSDDTFRMFDIDTYTFMDAYLDADDITEGKWFVYSEDNKPKIPVIKYNDLHSIYGDLYNVFLDKNPNLKSLIRDFKPNGNMSIRVELKSGLCFAVTYNPITDTFTDDFIK